MNDTIDTQPLADPSRRSFLKLSVAGLLASVAIPAFSHQSWAQGAAPATGRKVLVVYYSRSGNTREVASQIHQALGGDIVEIQTVSPYPADYKETTTQAKQELESGFKPPITTKIADIASYDVVFVGSPNWWGTIATPVMTFLTEHDLSGKTIAPFITHEGSALGRSAADIGKLCPKANILEGLAVRGKSAKSAQDDVAAWLRKLGLKS
ncbi:flavodoxin [Fundidesulfovibrio putealis]|uniref:flavodoxin n=1 Tax=Fundidesulfovibrio putealis TaxID=270496 RepID=UPI000413DBAA|nr:flavodoxin [Fundidesulfovibrio putealis]